jgi:tyrosyl-tRNA synthetase
MQSTGLLDQLERHGIIDQVTNRNALDELLAKPGASIYVGFDPTADSLHVGHMLPALMLARFQRAGHRPVVLVGGATGMIGDPSGRGEERQLLSLDEIRANAAAVGKQLSQFVSFEGPNAALMVNNADWTAPISHLEWLRDVGKYFTVNYMVAKESVRRRLEDRDHGISYTEFSYMLLQANDFLYLFDKEGCAIQAGGSDQWGNITAGIELIRKARGGEAFGITFPLLTTSSGEKFGKSAGNAVWLDPARTSPYQFYQYWIRTDDRDVERLLKLFTFLELEEIASIIAGHAAAPEQRIAQKKLAEEVTRLVHGGRVEGAIHASEALFRGQAVGLTAQELEEAFGDVPSFTISRSEFEGNGMKPVDLLVRAGAVKSKSEAARLIAGGGAYFEGVPLHATMTVRGFPPQTIAQVLRVGKKSYYLMRLTT